MIKKKILLFFVFTALAAIWGWNQPDIFPIERYGPLAFITAFVGGNFLAFIMGYLFDRIDEKKEE